MKLPSFASVRFPLQLLLRIPLRSIVIDVGSGGNPYPRANVLLDRSISSVHRYGKPLVDSKLLILSNTSKCLFDKTLDFLFALMF